jgi:hypothetical protein
MVHRQVLYGVLPDGSDLHCLAGGNGDIDHWSADGRYYFDAKGQVDSLVAGGSDLAYSLLSVASEEFARPTADSSYFQTTKAGGGGIARFDFATQQETAVSKLGGASDLTISPDSKTLAYYGFDSDTSSARIWTVSTAGGEPTSAAVLPSAPLPNGQTFATANDLTFISNDTLLYLQSSTTDQGGPYQLVRLQLGQTPQVLATVGQKLDAQVMANLVAAGNGSSWVATDYGDCTDGISTSVYDLSQGNPAAQAVPVPSSYDYTTPVGWLPDGRLALLGRTDDCHGSGDLLLWKPGDSGTSLLASGVSSAALRVTGNVQVPARITP